MITNDMSQIYITDNVCFKKVLCEIFRNFSDFIIAVRLAVIVIPKSILIVIT